MIKQEFTILLITRLALCFGGFIIPTSSVREGNHKPVTFIDGDSEIENVQVNIDNGG